ncbi:unnamed protein product [Mytilus edulis]|uniref:Roc domain-containing protein n=1 Tax=Mytilus edulis TaxID=6550 RepID=A0A8S3SBM0_MYTED|nr:unnamed protein product [Mytilus edulis]
MEDSDGDITDIVTSGDEDSDDADVEMQDNAARQPNPWFSVVDKETFELDVNRDFEERIGPCGFEANFSPVDYFDKFLKTEDDDLIDRIVDETNRYANQCQTTENPTRHARSNEWSPVSYAEMRAFIGLVLAMGIVKKSSIESYWEASGISETPNFRDVMSRNRFQAILRYLHCSDNTTAVPRGQPGYDPLHKINPVVEFFNEVFELNYRLSQNIVVDERIVGFKGRHVLKQYISNKKAHRWGAKLFVLAESRTGYTHQINVYKGKRNTERHPNGQGYKSVMDLVRPHFGKNHHVTMDNWFSSPKLMNDLRNRGTYATGTVIARRKGLPASFKTARLPKGSVVVKSQRDLLAILYVDRRNVTFLTTSENARTVRKVNSKGRVVSAPSVVHKYNQTMGGVDLGDQLLLKFEPQFKSVKLWRKILFNLLTTATVNAYICYRNCFLVQRKLDHVKFQNAVVRGLIGDFRGGNRRRGRRPDNIPIANAIRMHFLDVIPDGKRRKCVKCSAIIAAFTFVEYRCVNASNEEIGFKCSNETKRVIPDIEDKPSVQNVNQNNSSELVDNRTYVVYVTVCVVILSMVFIATVCRSIWKESRYLDEETKETYLKDIRSGEERHRHIRVAIIGEKGVGKTCLLRRLLKQSIEGVQSTDGVNIEVSKCKIRLRDGKWESYKEKENELVRADRLKRALAKLKGIEQNLPTNVSDSDADGTESDNRSDSSISGERLSNTTVVSSDQETGEIVSETHISTSEDIGHSPISVSIKNDNGVRKSVSFAEQQIGTKIQTRKKIDINKVVTGKQRLLDQIHKQMISNDDNMEYVDCDLWDFAGEREYYATHQAFISSSCIFLLVADISKDVMAFTSDSRPKSGFDSIGEYIDFWINNVHCFAKPTVGDTKKLQPPIIIVGTGTDKIKQELLEIKKEEFKTKSIII